MTSRRATSTIVCALLCALAWAPATAWSDADPPSDILLVQNDYFPYNPVVSSNLQRALTNLTTETQHQSFPIKVAIIASPTDLGGIPALWGQPQRYAPFLASEIAFNGKQLVLVVMPAGMATANIPHADALAGLPVDASHGSNGLARTAITAVVRLARANGHPVKAPSVSGGGSSSGLSPAIAFGIPVVLVIIAALLAGLSRRQRRQEEEHLADSKSAEGEEVDDEEPDGRGIDETARPTADEGQAGKPSA